MGHYDPPFDGAWPLGTPYSKRELPGLGRTPADGVLSEKDTLSTIPLKRLSYIPYFHDIED